MCAFYHIDIFSFILRKLFLLMEQLNFSRFVKKKKHLKFYLFLLKKFIKVSLVIKLASN